MLFCVCLNAVETILSCQVEAAGDPEKAQTQKYSDSFRQFQACKICSFRLCVGVGQTVSEYVRKCQTLSALYCVRFQIGSASFKIC